MTKSRLLGIFLALGSLLLITLIITDGSPLLRGPQPDSQVWFWTFDWQGLKNAWPLVLVVMGYLVIGFWWLHEEKVSKWVNCAAVGGLFMLVIALQMAVLYLDRGDPVAELIDRTLAVNSNGYFTTALDIDDLNVALRDYPSSMPRFDSEHARTHPPGLVVLNWLAVRGLGQFDGVSAELAQSVRPNRCNDIWLYNQPDRVPAALGVMAVLPVLTAALCVIPAYFLAKSLASTGGKLATLFVATIPALLLFAPLPDQLFALLTLLIIWSLHEGIQREKAWLFLVSGILLSFSTFLSLGNGVVVLIVMGYALLSWWVSRKAWTARVALWATLFAVGAASLWLIYWVGWGVAPWAIAQAGIDQHYELVTQFRSYTTWLGYNWVDLLVFVGLPVLVGFLAASLLAIPKLRRRSADNNSTLAFTLLIFLIILSLSGTTRGETGRLWLFFMPLLAIVAGNWYTTLWRSWQPRMGLVALQLAFVVALALAWQQVDAVIVIAEPPAATIRMPQTTINARFDENIWLMRYHIDKSGMLNKSTDADTLPITLYWTASTPSDYPYTVFVHLVNAAGELVAQSDGYPVNGAWPSTCWLPETIVADTHIIPLPTERADGAYALRVGLYDARTGDRLSVNGADYFELEAFSAETP